MRLFLLTAFCALGIVGCDLPTDPVPTNPYDPLFDGPRVATAPLELQLGPSSGASLTVRWADPSSFETGFRVERQTSPPTGGFTSVATLAPNTTEFTDAELADGQERQYRVVTLADGETNSVPSPLLRVRRSREYIRFDGLRAVDVDAPNATFSLDGSRGYIFTGTTAIVVDARDGSVDGVLIEALAPVGALTGGRFAVRRSTGTASVPVGIYDGATLTEVVTLAADPSCPQLLPASVVVTPDARTFAGLCRSPGLDSRTVAVWSAAGGAPARLITAPGVRAAALDLSTDGNRVSVTAVATASGGRELSVLDTRSGSTVWSTRDSRVAGVPLPFSPDGQQLLDPGPNDIRLLAANTGAVLAVQAGVTSRGGLVSFAADGQSVALVTAQGGGSIAVLRTSDLAVTNRITDTQTKGLRLLAAEVVVCFRISPLDGSDVYISRWDPRAAWEVVPGT